MSNQENLSRRALLKSTVAIMLGGALYAVLGENRKDPVFGIEFDRNREELSFNELSRLAKRLDKASDKIPEVELEPTPETLYKLALEIIPQFEYEGIVETGQYPANIGFNFYTSGDASNHILGQSDCMNYVVLNGKISLDTSAWYKRDIPFTLAHELAHVAQTRRVCNEADRSLVENSAQVGAIEVCSGLALQGNKIFLEAVVGELRGMAISSAWGAAMAENRMNDFLKLRGQLSPGAMSEARFAKSMRRWSSDPDELQTVLYRYNITPLNMIAKAITQNGAEIEGLAYPEIRYKATANSYQIFPEAQPIKLDDTKYLLEHLEEIVDEVKK